MQAAILENDVIFNYAGSHTSFFCRCIHIKIRASCNKSVDILQQLVTTSNLLQQADVRMRSHDLPQLVTASLLKVVNRLVASLLFQQVCCKLIIFTGLLQIVSTGCNKPANDKLQQA